MFNFYCYAECHYTGCYYGATTVTITILSITINKSQHSAKWLSIQIVVMLSVIYARKRALHAECRYAECHYAVCLYAECRGANSVIDV
jgi:hypothetical protein